MGLGATSGMVTVWLSLSASTPASGCMDFVRGSHKNPILPHHDTFDDGNLLSRGQEVIADVGAADKTAIEIHPGQISLHHGLTIHGSGPNTTDDRRIACVIRYINPDVMQEVGARDYAMMARGWTARAILSISHRRAPPLTRKACHSMTKSAPYRRQSQ